MTRLATALLGTALFAAFTAGAVAQPRPGMGPQPSFGANFDPAQLPETKGTVAQYTLTPWGVIDGMILADGTEIHLPPNLSSELVFAVRPGDAVSIRGLRARAVPMVDAVSVTNDATGIVVGGQQERKPQDITGVVKETLHTPRGEAGGVLLADGTVVRLPPPEATKLAAILAPGQTIVVRGQAITSPLGHMIAARQIGPTADKLTDVGHPHMRDGDRWGMHGHMPPPAPPAPQPN